MNLSELVVVARRHHARGRQIKALEAEQEADGAQILAELARRNKTVLEHEGVTVGQQSKRYGYFLDVLRARLKPAVLRRVTRLEPDTEALRKELKLGNVTPADLEAAERRSKPWPVITIPDEEAKAA